MVLSAFAIIFMTEPYADVDSNAICTYGRGRTKALSILKKLNAAGLLLSRSVLLKAVDNCKLGY